MSFGISFGSIGDLIAVGQIAWSLAQAVSSTRGSAKEFQGLVNELKTFNNVLLQVVALWQNYESSPELDELGKITKHEVEEWRNSLWEFRLRFEKKYGVSLRPGGSGNWAKDASKKVLWLKEKDDIIELRRKINGASGTITLLVLAAMGTSNKLDDSTQRMRIEEVHCELKQSMKLAEDQNTHLKNLHKKMDLQAQSSDLILTKVTNSISTLTQVKSIVIDVKGMLEFFRAQISVAESTPRGLDTYWRQAPVTLEDALGNLIPIPLELINSWDMFETVLVKRFETLKGHQKVVRKEYAIEDGRSGREVSSKKEWSMSFRPGQKFNMAMVFKQHQATTSCPGCKTEADSTGEFITQCKECGMWFQQIEELIGPLQRPASPEAEFPALRPRSPTRQTKISEIIEDSPGDFKRVRLLYQGNRWDHLKELEPVLFMDARGRKFSFPFPRCHLWPGMAQLITESFQYDVSMGPRVTNGQYDIVGPAGNKISPQDWEATIEPGMSITMQMWPILDSGSAEVVRDGEPSPVQSTEPELEKTNGPSKGGDEDPQQGRLKTSNVSFSVTDEMDLRQLREALNKHEDPTVKPKAILRTPREKFPEDELPIREGVAPLKDVTKYGIPPDARWTKISRRMVNPKALEAGKERYEAREDFVIVLRVLTREEINAYAVATQRIRAVRLGVEQEEHRRRMRESRERRRREQERAEREGYRLGYSDNYEDDHDPRRERKDRGLDSRPDASSSDDDLGHSLPLNNLSLGSPGS